MDRIVVPLDGSSWSESVMPVAIRMGEALGASWVLLQVMVPLTSTWGAAAGWGLVAPPVSDDLETSGREQALTYLQAVRAHMPHPERVEVDVRSDMLPGGILRAVEDHQASMIAMSTHGRGGVNRLVMGSVTDLVVRLASVPVLVVRPTANPLSPTPSA